MYKAKSQKSFIYKQKDQKSNENIQENKKEKVEIIQQKYNVKAKFDLKMNKGDLEEIEKLEKKYPFVKMWGVLDANAITRSEVVSLQ